ncbi:MAG: laccase domain-containing protein [Acidobacteria bacterium]|nr:laccase domain-containing protein [Acidobacteriota bacterium]
MPVVSLVPDTSRGVTLWRFPGLPVAGLDLAVTSRAGGVSTGPYAGLNLGTHVGDSPTAVALNGLMLSSAFGGDRVSFVHQVHGTDIVRVSEINDDTAADGIIVDSGDPAAGIRVADCVPLALINPHTRRCVMVHAGWRGLALNIIDKARAIAGDDGAPVLAVVGPSISGATYQVGPEVIDAHSDFAKHAVHDIGDRSLLDLRGVVRTQLARVGVDDAHTWMSREVTDGGDTFFSDRAARPCGRFALLARWES